MINDRPIIGITGSCGKTTTRELIAALLATRWKVFKNHENGNNAWFIERYLTEIDASHKALVLEYGLRTPDCIRDCCALIQPNMAIITNIGRAHLGNFNANIQELVKAKAQIIAGLPAHGYLFLNADDENSRLIKLDEFPGKLIKISIGLPSDYQAKHIQHDEKGIRFELMLQNTNELIEIALLGRHNIYNVLFSIAVADNLGFSATEIKTALASFYRIKRRLNYYRLANNNHLIDDTCNSSPEANIAAIDVLAELGSGHKIAILGSMLDQNGHPDAYVAVGKHMVNKIDMLHTLGCIEVGQDAKIIGEAAIAAGFPKEAVMHHDSHDAFKKWLRQHWTGNNTFLVKGTLTYSLAYHIARQSLRLGLLKYHKKTSVL